MTKLKVVTFSFEHIKEFVGRTEDKGRLIFEDPTKWKQIAESSIAYSALCNDELVFCGGVLIYRPGFGEGWILSSVKVALFASQVLRLTKKYLKQIIEKYDLYRVQATVRCDWKQAQRFLEAIGFQREGLMRKYGLDQSDYYMYSRVT